MNGEGVAEGEAGEQRRYRQYLNRTETGGLVSFILHLSEAWLTSVASGIFFFVLVYLESGTIVHPSRPFATL